jgi:hypothetical protein
VISSGLVVCFRGIGGLHQRIPRLKVQTSNIQFCLIPKRRVSTQRAGRTDGRTDGQTDRQAERQADRQCLNL